MTSIACRVCAASRARCLCEPTRSGRILWLVGTRSRPQRCAAYPRAPLRAFPPDLDRTIRTDRRSELELELGDHHRAVRRFAAGTRRRAPGRRGSHRPRRTRGRWAQPSSPTSSTSTGPSAGAAEFGDRRHRRVGPRARPGRRILAGFDERGPRYPLPCACASAYGLVEFRGSKEREVDHNVVLLILARLCDRFSTPLRSPVTVYGLRTSLAYGPPRTLQIARHYFAELTDEELRTCRLRESTMA